MKYSTPELVVLGSAPLLVLGIPSQSGDNGSSVPFDEPSSVQFDGRRMIVTNDAFFSGDASHFVIFDVWAGEPGQPVFVPGLGAARYRLRVRPRRTRVGVRRLFHFHATLGRTRVRGALVRFAGRRVRTNRRGNARIRARFHHRGRRRATLSVGKSRRVVARTSVRVRRAHRR